MKLCEFVQASSLERLSLESRQKSAMQNTIFEQSLFIRSLHIVGSNVRRACVVKAQELKFFPSCENHDSFVIDQHSI